MALFRFVPDPLVDLRPATADEVASTLRRSDPKQCPLDAAPTWLIKHVGDVLVPVTALMCNASFNQVKLPDCSKKAIVRPLLKKQTIDPNDPASFRPISNLSFMSKVVEKVVDARIAEHVNRHQLLPVGLPSTSFDGNSSCLHFERHDRRPRPGAGRCSDAPRSVRRL